MVKKSKSTCGGAEKRPNVVTQQPFQALAVGRFEAHASVEREAATVLSASHHLSVSQLEHTAWGQSAQ